MGSARLEMHNRSIRKIFAGNGQTRGSIVMKLVSVAGGLALAGLALSGCVSSGPREGASTVVGAGAGALTGGIIGGALGGSTGTVVGALTGGLVGGIAGNAIGRDLDEQDRQAALDAETYAFQSGQRRPWRGAHGAYGYVEPGPEYVDARGTCRNFTHRVYVNGRPTLTNGIACLRPDGLWQIVG
jgi:surface antigen